MSCPLSLTKGAFVPEISTRPVLVPSSLGTEISERPLAATRLICRTVPVYCNKEAKEGSSFVEGGVSSIQRSARSIYRKEGEFTGQFSIFELR